MQRKQRNTPRYGLVLVDCRKAQTIYEQLDKSVRRTLREDDEIGSMTDARIRGGGTAGIRKLYARIGAGSVRRWESICAVEDGTIICDPSTVPNPDEVLKGEPEVPLPVGDWRHTSNPRSSAIANLQLDKPGISNDGDGVSIGGTLRLGIDEYEREDGSRVRIGVAGALLTMKAVGYRVDLSSWVGYRAEHENFEPTNEGARIVGPKPTESGGMCLDGEALQSYWIARMEPAAADGSEPAGPGATAASVTAAVYAFPGDFHVSMVPMPDPPELDQVTRAERQKALDLLIRDNGKDGKGRVLLANDKLIRKEVP